MMNKAYESEPLPFTLSYDQYQNGINNAIIFYNTNIKDNAELKQVIDFIASDNERTKLTLQNGEKINFSPTKKLKITVDSASIMKTGTIPVDMANKIVPSINWDVRQNYLYKNDLMLLDIIATNNWERPIYFANPSSVSKVLDIEEYCHLDGFVYKFLPVKAENYIEGVGGINADTSYNILMNKCKWGNLNDPNVTVDRESYRNSIMPKQNFMRVAEALVAKGENEKAIALLDRCFEAFPDDKISFDMYIIPFAGVYYSAGEIEKGNAINQRLFEIYSENLDYYNSVDQRLSNYFETDYNQSLGVLQRLSMMARKNKQTDLYEEIDSVFNENLQYLEK